MAGGIRRRRLLGGIATAVGVAVAGCSSGGSDDDGPTDDTGGSGGAETSNADGGTDSDGDGEGTSEEPPAAHVVDLKDASGENIGTRNTEQTWDDHRFDREALYENYVSQWHQAAVYDQVIQELENNNQEKYNGEGEGMFFSNSEYRAGNVEGYGHWDLNHFEQLEELQHILTDVQSATRIHQEQVHPTAYSGWNHRFAATIQEIANTFNQELNQFQEQNNEKAFRAGSVNERGHGTVITYTDLENTGIEGEHPWQFVNTTSGTIAPVTEDINTGGTFNPFVDSYQPADQTSLGYDIEKNKTIDALQSFAIHVNDPENFEWDKLAVADNLLEEMFNDHIPSAGSIDPILDLIEKAADVQLETGKHIQAYGESLDHYRLAVGDQELYNMGMTPGSNVDAEDVESYISETTG